MEKGKELGECVLCVLRFVLVDRSLVTPFEPGRVLPTPQYPKQERSDITNPMSQNVSYVTPPPCHALSPDSANNNDNR